MTAPATTGLARAAIRPIALSLRARLLYYLVLQGDNGATLEEAELDLGMAGNTLRPRRVELADKGYVEDSGRRRLTKAGRQAVVWVVPDEIRARCEPVLKTKGLL